MKTRESADFIADRAKDVTEKTGGLMDRGRELLQQQRDHLAAALEAGKQAYCEQKD